MCEADARWRWVVVLSRGRIGKLGLSGARRAGLVKGFDGGLDARAALRLSVRKLLQRGPC